MSSPVSYANIAKGQVPEQDINEISSLEISKEEVSEVEVASPEQPLEAAGSVESTEEKENEGAAAAKEKKPLAPAPVPSKSAWGTSAANIPGNVSVDEHKWPTPDKTSSSEQQTNTNQKQQKFIKPITNKWVPINAKVILPSGRNNSQKQKQNKKNKKGTNTPKKQTNGQNNQNTQNNQSTNPDFQSPQAQNINRKDGQFESPEQFQQPQDGFKPRFNGQFQGQPQGPSQQKNMRRFNNGNVGNFKPRFTNQPQQPQQQQTSPQPNGFYHPQPFVQTPNFQNFNNQQFRPNQFRHQNNRSFHQPVNGANGFMNGAMGLPQQIPQQIPPPISPKQDPQQALTQQIDYYFSLENLIKDIYLRKNMDSQGWVALALILNFKRVKIIINGIQNSIENKETNSSVIILDSLKHCENLEINYLNGKNLETADIDDIELRVKGNFEQWLLPSEN